MICGRGRAAALRRHQLITLSKKKKRKKEREKKLRWKGRTREMKEKLSCVISGPALSYGVCQYRFSAAEARKEKLYLRGV